MFVEGQFDCLPPVKRCRPVKDSDALFRFVSVRDGILDAAAEVSKRVLVFREDDDTLLAPLIAFK